MVLCRQIKGNNLINKINILQPKQNYHSESSEKIKKTKEKESDDEPSHRQEVKNIMKIRTANELKELNAALNNCTNTVWLMGPNDECYNMKNEEEYIEGIIRLAEDHNEQLGFFTASREDEKTMMHFLEQMAA